MNTRSRYATLAALLSLVVPLSPRGSPPLAEGQTPTPRESLFEVEARVSPTPVPVGSSIELFFTIANRRNIAASFDVDGCPVHYRVDGEYSPAWTCPETERRVELEPDQTITFGPEDGGLLVFDPHAFPLGPGTHRVVMAARGVGSAEVEFTVEPVAAGVAAAAGRVLDRDGKPASPPGIAALSRSLSDAAESDAYRTPLSDEGYFLFPDVDPSGYVLRVEAQGQTLWYPGVFDPLMAERVYLAPGEFTELEFAFRSPEFDALEGTVYEDAQGVPLPEAAVMAVPVWPEVRDTTWEDTSVGSDTGAVLDGGFRMAITDANGRFRLQVPEGVYRLAAGKLVSHRYQYWDRVRAFAEAEVIRVPDLSLRAQPELRFHLARLDNADLAGISGQVLAFDPVTDDPPEPLAEAEVTAVPILPSGSADIAPHRTLTDKNGMYSLEVPADTPYLVHVVASGYEARFYRDANRRREARWVDVVPGRTHDGISFVLQPAVEGPGSVEGFVVRRLPDADCDGLGAEGCWVPAAGALVRLTPAFPTFAPTEILARVARNGRFRVDGLMADHEGTPAYFVSAQLDDGEPGFYPGGVPFPEAEPLHVFSGSVSSAGRILVPVRRGPVQEGFVTGWVRDPEQNPVENAVVRAYVHPDRPDGRVVRGRTDAAGRFRIGDLPVGARVLVSVEAEEYVPAYYPGVSRWREAELVPTGGPRVRVTVLKLTVEPKNSFGAFFQAARVRVGDGSAAPATAGDDPALTPRESHDSLRGAFFFLYPSTAGTQDPPAAGASTGDNGAVILNGLGAGSYVAMADRPGFEPAYFIAEGDDRSTPIHLNELTPAVLAHIALHPSSPEEKAAPPDDRDALVTNLANVPNPFQPRTAIRYRLEVDATVTVQIFDYRGRIVRTLVEGQAQSAGLRELFWDGRDKDGKRVSSGVYFYRIRAGDYAVARKMVVLP